MIKRDDLIDIFERMLLEHWAYELGAARDGCVDCSGAFVYAYKQLGGPAIEHGSNSIFHLRIGNLFPMSQAKPGYAAFKIRPWTEDQKGNRWYGYDPGDLYHIGLVGRDGKILNAQGKKNGFVSSDASTWEFFAPLMAVDYGEEMEDENVLYQAIVETEKDPLRIRQSAVDGKVLGNVPRGETVDVLADSGDGWPRVRYGGLVGYASGDFLTPVVLEPGFGGDPGPEGTPGVTTLINDDGQTITIVGNWRVAND